MSDRWWYLYSICPTCGYMNEIDTKNYPYFFCNEGKYDVQCSNCGSMYKGDTGKTMVSRWARMELNDVE